MGGCYHAPGQQVCEVCGMGYGEMVSDHDVPPLTPQTAAQELHRRRNLDRDGSDQHIIEWESTWESLDRIKAKFDPELWSFRVHARTNELTISLDGTDYEWTFEVGEMVDCQDLANA